MYARETEFRFAASGTNWLLGAPQWNDGNDIADFTPTQIEELRTTGQTSQRLLARSPDSRQTGIQPVNRPGFVIDVVVEP